MRERKLVLRLTPHMLQKDIILFLICLYIFSRDLFPLWVEIGILSLASVLTGLHLLNAKRLEMSKMLVLYLVTFLFVLINNANIKNMEFRNITEYFMAFLLFLDFKREKGWAGAMISMLVFGGMIHAIATIVLYFAPDFYRQNILTLFDLSQQRELLSQYNHGWMPGLAPHYSTNGMYLGIGLGAAFVKATAKRGKRKIFSYIVPGIILLALLMTGKRAHVLFSVAACCAVIVLRLNRKNVLKLFKIVLFAFFSALIIYWISSYIPAVANVFNRFIETAKSGDVTMGRRKLWGTAIMLWKQNPLFGIGWDRYKYLAPSLVGFFLNVHNVYIQLLCEVGVVGAGVFYIFFITAFIYSVRVIRLFFKSSESILSYADRTTVLFGIYMQIFFLLYCVTGNPLYDAPTFFPYIFSCAIAEYYHDNYCSRTAKTLTEGRTICV